MLTQGIVRRYLQRKAEDISLTEKEKKALWGAFIWRIRDSYRGVRRPDGLLVKISAKVDLEKNRATLQGIPGAPAAIIVEIIPRNAEPSILRLLSSTGSLLGKATVVNRLPWHKTIGNHLKQFVFTLWVELSALLLQAKERAPAKPPETPMVKSPTPTKPGGVSRYTREQEEEKARKELRELREKELRELREKELREKEEARKKKEVESRDPNALTPEQEEERDWVNSAVDDMEKSSNPFISETPDGEYEIGFWAPRRSAPLWWTGGGFKNLDSPNIRSKPEVFDTWSDAAKKVRSELLDFIRQWRSDQVHLIFGWDR